MRLFIAQSLAWGIVVSIVVTTYQVASYSLFAVLAFIIMLLLGVVALANIGTYQAGKNEPTSSISSDAQVKS